MFIILLYRVTHGAERATGTENTVWAKEQHRATYQTIYIVGRSVGRLRVFSNGTGVFVCGCAHCVHTQINSKPKTILFSLMIYVIAVWTEGGKYVRYLCSWVFCLSGRMERGYFSLLCICKWTWISRVKGRRGAQTLFTSLISTWIRCSTAALHSPQFAGRC